MTKFFEAFANVFRIPDLRKRVLFTLALLAVYRIGAYIPTPGIDTDRFQAFFTRNAAFDLNVGYWRFTQQQQNAPTMVDSQFGLSFVF